MGIIIKTDAIVGASTVQIRKIKLLEAAEAAVAGVVVVVVIVVVVMIVAVVVVVVVVATAAAATGGLTACTCAHVIVCRTSLKSERRTYFFSSTT